jgi:hypothetical protein
MTDQEAIDQVNAMTDQVNKIGTETDSLLAQIQSGNISPGLEAALGNLKTAIQAVDDKVPDAPTSQSAKKK